MNNIAFNFTLVYITLAINQVPKYIKTGDGEHYRDTGDFVEVALKRQQQQWVNKLNWQQATVEVAAVMG